MFLENFQLFYNPFIFRDCLTNEIPETLAVVKFFQMAKLM
ncbi:MAG: hypothetical protein US47_C0006G0005, partial [Candidatus Moranbacteria bacterium GW2011_GWE1_37_24]